jgi:hypothetical protein
VAAGFSAAKAKVNPANISSAATIRNRFIRLPFLKPGLAGSPSFTQGLCQYRPGRLFQEKRREVEVKEDQGSRAGRRPGRQGC